MSSAFIASRAIYSRRAAVLGSPSSQVHSNIWHSSFALRETATSFDPVAPDVTTLVGFGIVVIVCAIAAYVWSNQVVPISRTKLALAKQKNSNSELRQYLDELAALSKTNAMLTTEANEGTASAANEQIESEEVVSGEGDSSDTEVKLVNDRAFERWLFTDWLEQDKRRGGRQKEPAIPILKTAKWNSGDNPVLAATALILSGVLLTALTERITNSF
jgi:hypothetical protein